MAHDGYARAISPTHTPGDGDTIFSLATGAWTNEPNLSMIGALAAEAMADAIVRAVTQNDEPGRCAVGARAAHRAGAVQVAMARRIDRANLRPAVGGRCGGRVVLAAPWSALERSAPAIIQSDGSLPGMPQGVAAGAAGPDGFVVWSRSDRPARHDRRVRRPPIEFRRRRDGSRARRRSRAPTSPRAPCCTGCRAASGSSIACCSRTSRISRASAGRCRAASHAPRRPRWTRRHARLVSADTVGQGWGINPEWGGLRLYDAMRQVEPDSSSTPATPSTPTSRCSAEVKLDDGTIWKNVVTEAKSRAAQSVADFRGAYQYNLIDEHMRRFNARPAQVVQWDDHEVRDNWYPTRDLSNDAKYTRQEHGADRRARAAGVPRVQPGAGQRRRSRTRLPDGRVRPARRDLRARSAQLSRSEQPNQQPTLDEESALAGRDPARVAQGAAGGSRARPGR